MRPDGHGPGPDDHGPGGDGGSGPDDHGPGPDGHDNGSGLNLVVAIHTPGLPEQDYTYPLTGPNAVSDLVVHTGGGNAKINVDNHVTLPALLFGDTGSVQINAGGGPTVLIGGTQGNNQLHGGPGGDILIAGTLPGGRPSQLQGGSSQDILIGRYTNYDDATGYYPLDANEIALKAIG